MIRRQRLPVLHVGKDDVAGGIHCNLPQDTSSVLGPTATWQFLSAFEAHVDGPTGVAIDPTPLEHAPQRYTAPHRSGGGTGAPVEANALLHHVLLLAAVGRANKRDRELATGEVLGQLVQREAGWALD